ncbi:unnamed protein product [Spirodela intermedia]|uniref:Uncharacterized protein n=1 Tax=Spirodela intermedia TaxID=51605 RepID=A0A7I8LEB5_SPIIN|nr:unnamed protein product [Spirodela intermedia]
MRASSFLATAGGPATMAVHQQLPPRTGWHSPVPYLFGGLAAMLGLIAFALLILACSYWKLSGYLDSGSNEPERGGDLESGDGKPRDSGVAKTSPHQLEQRIVVIMAGEEKPTFLANPMSSWAPTCGDYSKSQSSGDQMPDEKKTLTDGSGEAGPEAAHNHQRRQEETREDQRRTQQLHNVD